MSDDYSFAYNIQGIKTQLSLSSGISFSVIDSIYSLYNRMTVSIEDSMGLFQEAFLTSPGVVHEIDFGFGNDHVGGKFFIDQTQSLERITPGVMAGRVDANLINSWAYGQSNKFTAYKDRISSIVDRIVSPSFPVVKNDTGNLGTWLQPGMTDARFINEILLPNAFSKNSDGSPFYAWIGNDGNFNFRSFSAMMSTNSKKTLYYRPFNATGKLDATAKAQAQTTIMDIKPFSKPAPVKDQKTNFFYIDPKTGQAQKITDSLLNHPSQTFDGPITPRVLSKQPGMIPMGVFSSGQQENLKGLQAFYYRDSLMLEKLLVLLPPNLSLCSGSKVTLEAILGHEDVVKHSTRHSGDYLVEMSEHLWSDREKMGFSKLLLSRKVQKVPSDTVIAGYFQ